MKALVGNVGLLVGILVAGVPMSSVAARHDARGEPARAQGPSQDLELNALLSAEARRVMQGVARLEGQHTSGPVSATMNLATRDIVVHFSREFLPDSAEARFEDQLDSFRHALMEASAPFLAAASVQYRFDGKDIFFYFPKLRKENDEAREAEALHSVAGAGVAMVSAGHGYYLRLVKGVWVAQRDPKNGVLEDLITPLYAEELRHWIQSRSQMPVHRPRTTSSATHEPSGRPWWQVAGRYHLQVQYPGNAEIWNSLGSGSSDDHHYNEDIRSRPLLANHQNADVALHLHTNAADQSATGTRVIYQTGSEQGRVLASSVLCYMRELITATDGYKDFVVSREGHPDNKGENRLARMPSVIVEAAFHTNPEDALALQDPVFRTASMKGVEKGYRLWREGQDCKPLKVDPIETVTVRAGQSQVIDLDFDGFPQYPVVIETKNVACPPGWTCTDGRVTLPDAASGPAHITMRCENRGSAPIYWKTQMIDEDGVRSPPVQHIVQCLRSASPATASPQSADLEGVATATQAP